jgi:hypothetical protein
MEKTAPSSEKAASAKYAERMERLRNLHAKRVVIVFFNLTSILFAYLFCKV